MTLEDCEWLGTSFYPAADDGFLLKGEKLVLHEVDKYPLPEGFTWQKFNVFLEPIKQ